MASPESKPESKPRKKRGTDYRLLELSAQQGVAEFETYVRERTSKAGYRYYVVPIPSSIVNALMLKDGTPVRVRIEKLR